MISVPDVHERPEAHDIIGWKLEAGDAVLFDGCTLHGAVGSPSLTDSRRAFSTRWFADDCRFAPRPWDVSPPITGDLQKGQAPVCATFPRIWTEAFDAV